MKTFTRTCLILWMGTVVLSCDQDYCYDAGVRGEWVWDRSESGWGDFYPVTESQQRTLKIGNAIFREYEGGELRIESPYTIIEADDRLYGSPRTIDIDEYGVFILTLDARHLILDESYNPDASTHYYKRP